MRTQDSRTIKKWRREIEDLRGEIRKCEDAEKAGNAAGTQQSRIQELKAQLTDREAAFRSAVTEETVPQ
jgi:hypothetical protein